MANLKVLIGEDLDSKKVYLDLNDLSTLIITGSSGKGKTNTVYNILDGLLDNEDIVIDIVDLRHVNFTMYTESNVTLTTTIDEFSDLLGNLRDDIYYRLNLCKENNCTKIADYNKLGKGVIPTRVLIIDEFLYVSENKHLCGDLLYLCSVGRAFGLKIIITSQKDRLVPGIMANAGSVIEFPSYFNSYLTKSLKIADSRVFSKGYATVLYTDGSSGVIKTPLNKKCYI